MEIKFRVWNHATEDWETDSQEADCDDENKGSTPNLYIVNTMYDKTKDGNQFTFQLSTGLIDADGVEIYEGDILNFLWDKKAEGGGYICGSRDFQPENEAKVYFENGCFNLEGHGNLYEKISFNRSALGWTVVGNIFEGVRAVAVTPKRKN